MTENNRFGWHALAVAPFLWIGVVFLVGGFYAVMQTDDFCTFGRLYGNSGNNPFREAWYMYMNWTGRFSASFVAAATGWAASISPFPGQWVYTLSIVAFVSALAWACLRASSLGNDQGRSNLLLGMIAFAAILALMPSKMEGVFWLTGAAVYSWGLVFLMLLFVSVKSDSVQDRPGFSIRTLLLIVIVTGFNEFLGIAVGAFLAIRLIAFARGRAYLRQNLAYWITFLASFAMTVLAPGNFVRNATMDTPRHDMAAALGLARESSLMFVGGHILPNLLLIVMLALAAFAAGWVTPTQGRQWRRLAPVWISLVAMFPVHMLVYTYLTGEHVPGRVINQAYAMAIVGGLLFAAYAGQWLRRRQNRDLAGPALVLVAAAGVMLVTSADMLATTRSIRDFGPVWRAEQGARMAVLKQAAASGRTSVVLAPFSPERASPPILQGADISPDPSYWVNRCVADFHDLESVVLGPATPE